MRAYLIIMAILGAITALATLPDLALVATILSFGLAAPFFVLCATGFAYGLCLLPTVMFGWRAAFVSAALVVALALIPSWLEKRALRAYAMQLKAVDVLPEPLTSSAPQVIALMNTSNRCSSFCEALLRGGAVKAVLIGNTASTNQKRTEQYTLESDQIVSAAHEAGPEANTADLTFWLGSSGSQLDNSEIAKPVDLRAIPALDVRRVTVTTHGRVQDLASDPLVRYTHVRAKSIAAPFFLIPALNGLTSGGNDGGLTAGRVDWKSDEFSLWDIAKGLGIATTPFETDAERRDRIRAKKRATENAQRHKALEYARASVYHIYAGVPHPEPNGPRQGDVSTWLSGITSSQKDLSDIDRTIIRQILDERDHRYANKIRWLFWQDDMLAKEFFPRLIAEFDRGDLAQDALILPMLERLRFGKDYQAEFEKYADQIQHIMEQQLERDPAQQYLGLVSAGYRFGIDERPFLNAFPTGSDLTALIKWKDAVCELPPDRLAGYTEEVMRRVEPVLMAESVSTLPKSYIGMFRFLISQGREAEVLVLLEKANIAVDRTLEANVFNKRWDSEALCVGRNRARFYR